MNFQRAIAVVIVKFQGVEQLVVAVLTSSCIDDDGGRIYFRFRIENVGIIVSVILIIDCEMFSRSIQCQHHLVIHSGSRWNHYSQSVPISGVPVFTENI
ncbi:hypothetical protein D3C85_1638290 [compost metagenome]